MLKVKSWFLAAGVFAVFSVQTAMAEGLKIAYVDVKSAVENTQAYQAGIKKLKALQAKKQKELDALRKKIEQAEKDLLSQSMAMSPDVMEKRQNEIKEMRKQFSRMMQDAKDELAGEKNRLDMTVGSKFQRVIKEFGKNGHYDYIFGQPVLLYADPKHDITAEITRMLDKN
ncbi:MAG: OmpH family outer membrane protein [Zetaproteobacteria bacterium]|nr:MAG: OmpH family outer membrane protein [Zetaproteobacteria bacterium]